MLLMVQIVLTCMVVMWRNEIPLHWNLAGEIDRTGSAYEIIWLVVISAAIYLLLTFLQRHPERCNFPFKYHDRDEAFRLMSELVGCIKLCIMLMMSLICVLTYTGSSMMGLWLIALAIIIFSVYYCVRLSKV